MKGLPSSGVINRTFTRMSVVAIYKQIFFCATECIFFLDWKSQMTPSHFGWGAKEF